MGFLGDLVEVAADPVKLPHKVVVGGRRRVLGDDAVNKMAQVNLLGKPAFANRFHKALVFFVVEPHLYAAVSFPHSLSSSWRRLI